MAPRYNKNATVENHGPNKLPLLLPGKMTPKALREWESACKDFFSDKDIAVDKQVRKCLGGIQDLKHRRWIDNNRERLVALTFKEFMVELRKSTLSKTWESDLLRELMSLKMNDNSFGDYSSDIQTMNDILASTTSFLSDERIRHTLEAGMTIELHKYCVREKINDEGDLEEWIYAVKLADEYLREETDKHKRMLEDLLRDKKTTSNSRNPSSSRPQNNQNNTTNSNKTFLPLPPLTDSRRSP
jgi:hypothetical protein